jgi:catechol 2,3-dioxygenase-like lactoylglutathione lyase family enzyme
VSVEFNHTIVLSKDRKKSAHFLAEILGLEVGAPTGVFLPVTTANGVTLDFLTIDADIPMQHYAFLVSEEEFDEALARLVKARIPIQADPHGNHPRRINRNDGGRGVYFLDPGGHRMEVITTPYDTQT